MPLFQPSNITPSSFAGVGGGTIAQADPIQITWQVNGNVPMTGFKIDIYQTQADNTVVRVGGTNEIISISPFYPTDNKGNPNFYPYKPVNEQNQPITWENWGVQDGNAYTMQITQYWTESTTNDKSIVQISQSSFISRSRPTLSILRQNGNEIGVVDGVALDLRGDYEQEQDDSIEWVRWQFYQINGNNNILLDDTGVVNTQILTYQLTNLLNANNYRIVCVVETTNGVQVTSSVNFEVSYTLESIIGQFKVDCTDKSSNLLSWSGIAKGDGDSILGVANGNYSFNNGNLVLPKNSSVAWEKVVDGETQAESQLNIGKPWTLAWKGMADNLKFSSISLQDTGKSFYALNSINQVGETNAFSTEIEDVLYCNSNSLYYAFDDTAIYLLNNINQSNTTHTIVYNSATGGITSVDISPNGDKMIVGVRSRLYSFSIQSNGSLQQEDNSIRLGETNILSAKYLDNNNVIILTVSTRTGRGAVEKWRYDINGVTLISNQNLPTTWGIQDGNISLNFDKSLFSVNVNLYNGDSNPYQCLVLSSEFAFVVPYSSFNRGLGKKGIFSPIDNTFVSGKHAYFINRDSVIETIKYLGEINSAFEPISFDSEGKVLLFTTNSIGGVGEACIYNQEIMGSRLLPSNYSNIIFIHSGYMFGNNGAKIQSYLVSINCPFRIENYSFGKPIYSAVISSITGAISGTNLVSGIDYTREGYIVSGTTDVPQYITATIIIIYSNVMDFSPIFTWYLETGWLVVKQEFRSLVFVIANSTVKSFIIPPDISTILFTVNANGITVYFDNQENSIFFTDEEKANYPQSNITSIVLENQQVCEWLVVENGNADILNNFIPSWGLDTRFLTNFALNTLQAGQVDVIEPMLDIYRQDVQSNSIQKIYSTNYETTQLRDFSWITGKKYKYLAYGRLDGFYTGLQTFVPEEICKKQNFYLLLETVKDEEQLNVYHVVNSWRFGANISAGSVSNNNQPNFLSNFTQYRLKQPTTRNSKSGVLSALLSNVQNSKYADTAEQMERLYDISNSLNTFFLKDMKGNLYMVSIANAITQTINTKSSVQEVTVSIPWEETGSAVGVSIIQTPDDSGWGNTEN